MTTLPSDPVKHESTQPGDLVTMAIEAAGDALHPCVSYASANDRAAAAYDLAQAIRCASPALTEAERAQLAAFLHPERGHFERELLMAFADHEDGPCRLDHHGECQDHPGGDVDGVCAIRAAREFLGLEAGR